MCGSNCTKLIAGVTPSGRSSQSSASGASASPVYFPSPTAASGSWLCTAPVWWHIPASFCLSDSSLLHSRTQAHSLCPRTPPLLPELVPQVQVFVLVPRVLFTEFLLSAELPSRSACQEGLGLAISRQCSSSVTLVPIV